MDGIKNRMSALTPFAKKHKVTVIGSGNWGSTIAKVVAENTASHPDIFERDVQMWVFEENVQLDQKSKHYNESSGLSQGPQKLTRIINELHENVKYLPGIPLPKNVVANPSITDAVKDSTILIFNTPHQFITRLCKDMRGHILPYARGISCIKGVNVQESSVSLFSETIGQELSIYCGALSGANIANEVAQEKFSETTIAYDPPAMDSQTPTPATSAGPSPVSSQIDLTKMVHKDVQGRPSKVKLRPLPTEYQPIDHETMKRLFHRRYFHVRVVSDVAGVSLGGALKNIVAVAAGWVDGLGWGDNAKAAIMRVGLLEMVEFGRRFFAKTINNATFTEESAGVADLITTCAGGRHHRCAKMSIQEGKSIEEIEARELNGQKLQGTLTAYEVNTFLKSQGAEKDFPLFTAVYHILEGKANAQDLPDLLEPEAEPTKTPMTDLKLPKSVPLPSPVRLLSDNSDSHQKISTNDTEIPAKSPDISRIYQTPEALKLEPGQPLKPSRLALIPPPPLASSRYNRQTLIPAISVKGQERLSSSKVLIIGLGGLGSPAALYLSGAGIHTLGLLDNDEVELSNLHRQIVHRESSVCANMTKVASAIRGCLELNSEIKYVGHEERLTSYSALEIISQYELVLDCTDNPATRYLISDACVRLNKVLVSGAAQRTEGQIVLLNLPLSIISSTSVPSSRHHDETPERGPCYRCIFPRPPSPEMVRGCGEIGILGTVVGTIGTLMAGEAIKLIVKGSTENMKPTMLLYNAWSADPRGMFRVIGLRGRRKDCIACGDDDILRNKGLRKITKQRLKEGSIDYEGFCGLVEELKILEDGQRVGAEDFLQRSLKPNSGDKMTVIDVREENEFEIGAKIPGSINIPISRILRKGNIAFDSLEEATQSLSNSENLEPEIDHSRTNSIFFVCQRGNDSQIAAQKLMERDNVNGRAHRWVGDVVGGFFAMEKADGRHAL